MRISAAPGEGVLDRAFLLLEAFSEDATELTLEQLALRAGLARSTAHRLVTQLVGHGALARTERGWRLGTRMFELGQLVSREQQLRELALPHMQDLFAVTGETVQLAVADAEEVLYVEIIAGHRRVPTPSRRGGRLPLHCTALGKVLLAFSPDAGREFLAGESPLEQRTLASISSREQLALELHTVRRLAVAYDNEEAAEGLRCVAAPILDLHGAAIAALSVSMPATGPLQPGQVAPAIQTVARTVSREARGAGLGRLALRGQRC